MADICMRSMVSGQVQGVGFRAATQRQAKQLGLTGWAKNLADGRVEVVFCGKEEAVKELQQWLYQGPPLAKVTSVQCKTVTWQHIENFYIS